MPIKENWSVLESIKFRSYVEFKEYAQKKYTVISKRNNTQNCPNCSNNSNNHKRQYILGSCGGNLCNKDSECKVRYKITNCSSNKTSYVVYRLNEHQGIQEIDNNLHVRGLSSKIKSMIATIINENGMLFAQQCHLKLSKLVKKEGQTCFINFTNFNICLNLSYLLRFA